MNVLGTTIAMKLSQQNVIGLKRMANEALVSDETFKALVKAACNVLSHHPTPTDLDLSELCSSKPDIIKEGFASLLILLIESSRHNLDTNTLLLTLENYNLNSSRLRNTAVLFESYKARFQTSLKRIGSSQPKIIDLKWRLDFCIKSSSLEHECREIYFVQIVAEQVVRNNLKEQTLLEKKICFTCSLQQLQDLIAKLKDATRLIQSITHAR